MDLFGIPGAVLVQAGPGGALLLTVMAIVTGRLVPRKSVEDVRADRDARIAEANARGDEWRAVATAQETRNDMQAHQIQQLLDTARTTNALIEGLKQATAEKHP